MNIIEYLVIFSLAAVVTVFNAMLFAWVAHYFVSEDQARIAAFSFVLGGMIYGDPFRFASYENKFALIAGLIVGTVFVYWQFFQREVTSG